MNILIVFATTEGQTRKIAQFCANQCIAHGHSALMIRAEDADEVTLALFDAAILAGSVHMGQVQQSLADFAALHADGLNGLPTLFLQVSLAAAGGDEAEWADLQGTSKRFGKTAGWKPGKTLQVAGAFRFEEYDFFKRWAMRWIASQRDQAVDAHGDTEYTDWQQLSAELTAWLEEADAHE